MAKNGQLSLDVLFRQSRYVCANKPLDGNSCPRMVRLKHRWTIGVLEQSGRSKTAFSRHDIRDAIQVRLGFG